ncbi:hypothetical protein ACFVH6_32650 [Spirillospora sp. NPDC127200]
MIRTGRPPALRLGAAAAAAALVLADSAALATTGHRPQQHSTPQDAAQQAGESRSAARTSAAAAPQSPDAVRGLKWRGTFRGPAGDDLWVRFDTRGLSYDTAAGSLANNKFTTVTLRVSNLDDLPKGTTARQRNDEVIRLLAALHRKGVKAYLYKRQWLQRADVNKPSYRARVAREFITDMSWIINRAKNLKIDGTLQGVMPVETNLDSTAAVRERALYIARGINAKTKGWLKSHTFMMPGAGMGPYFKDVHRGGAAWLTGMRGQTRHFAFVYKHMASQPVKVNRLARLNPAWERNVGFEARTPVHQQIKFLRETMGLSHLEYYMRAHRARFPNHTHVVFWGDQADGIAGISALDNEPRWNYNTVRALHRLLVKTNHWHGYFFNMPFTRAGATRTDLWRYLITVDRTGRRRKNAAMNRSNTHTVWNEWHNWPRENATY